MLVPHSRPRHGAPPTLDGQDDAVIGDMIAQQSGGNDGGNQSVSGNSGVGQALEEIPEESGEHNSNSVSSSSPEVALEGGGQSSRSTASAAAAAAPAAAGAAAGTRLPQARAVPSGRQLLSRGKVIEISIDYLLIYNVN